MVFEEKELGVHKPRASNTIKPDENPAAKRSALPCVSPDGRPGTHTALTQPGEFDGASRVRFLRTRLCISRPPRFSRSRRGQRWPGHPSPRRPGRHVPMPPVLLGVGALRGRRAGGRVSGWWDVAQPRPGDSGRLVFLLHLPVFTKHMASGLPV